MSFKQIMLLFQHCLVETILGMEIASQFQFRQDVSQGIDILFSLDNNYLVSSFHFLLHVLNIKALTLLPVVLSRNDNKEVQIEVMENRSPLCPLGFAPIGATF